jgi:sugar phosphate isomerase/epimerase
MGKRLGSSYPDRQLRKDWFLGVELRTQHAHKVESNLNAAQRLEVKKRFADSKVTCLGYGSNFEYHSPDPKVLRQNIDQTKEYILLCKDIGPPVLRLSPTICRRKYQRKKPLRKLPVLLMSAGNLPGIMASWLEVEVHGNLTQEIPNMKAIFEQVTEPNVKICWNCNEQDLLPPGLEKNFHSVEKWFGDTVHIRELNEGDYPYQQLFNLFTGN